MDPAAECRAAERWNTSPDPDWAFRRTTSAHRTNVGADLLGRMAARPSRPLPPGVTIGRTNSATLVTGERKLCIDQGANCAS
jgi:hypothetical protein